MELFKLYQNFFTSYIQFLHSGSQSIPCVYGLLPDTRQATYTSFLQILKQADATLNPGTVSTLWKGSNKCTSCSFPWHQCTRLFVPFLPLCILQSSGPRITRGLCYKPWVITADQNDSSNGIRASCWHTGYIWSVTRWFPRGIQPTVDHFEDVFTGQARRHGQINPSLPTLHVELPRMNEWVIVTYQQPLWGMALQDVSNCRCMSSKHMGVVRCVKKQQSLSKCQKYRDVSNRLKNVVSEYNWPVLRLFRRHGTQPAMYIAEWVHVFVFNVFT